jgi:hypothetical protein
MLVATHEQIIGSLISGSAADVKLVLIPKQHVLNTLCEYGGKSQHILDLIIRLNLSVSGCDQFTLVKQHPLSTGYVKGETHGHAGLRAEGKFLSPGRN